MLSFYLIWSLSYFLTLLLFAGFWPEHGFLALGNGENRKVSLLIPFRNESKNLSLLVKRLDSLTYPCLEVIFIDDHSEDGSFDLLKRLIRGNPVYSITRSEGFGKKSALEHGLELAKGAIIICSDADCSFPRHWIERMVAPFVTPEVQLVAGPVMVDGGGGFVTKFQKLDWASILLVTSYAFGTKRPLMCSAANLAYRRSAFGAVGGYSGNRDFLSGDDEFLLKKIRAHFGSGACLYLPYKEVLVMTDPEPTWNSLINQRRRWAGKWKAHRSFSHMASAVFSFVAQVVWLATFLLLFQGQNGCCVFFVGWMLKILSEKFFLGKVLKTFERDEAWWVYVLSSLLHPIYVLIVGIASIRGKFVWKGRGK